MLLDRRLAAQTGLYQQPLQKGDFEKGFRFVRLKNLRNTAATVLHNQGFDVKNIQGLLGHADVQTTANIYVCFDEQNMHGMVDTLSDALRPKV